MEQAPVILYTRLGSDRRQRARALSPLIQPLSLMALGTILTAASAASSLASAASSIFGDDGGGSGRNRGSRLRGLFEDRLERIKSQDATETPTFTAGVGALQEQTERQAERDEAQAAARGLGGSQFAVAQDANRANAFARQTRQLLVDSERNRQRREQNALSGIVDATRLEDRVAARRQERESRRRGRLGQIAGQALQAGATIFAGSGGGGG